MAIDKRLLEILCDPISKTPVQILSSRQLESLNSAIRAKAVQRVDGGLQTDTLSEALITADKKVIYRVDDGIPVMLAEEGIGTTQLLDFPN